MMIKATCFAALMCATATAHAAGDKYDEHGFQMGAAFGRSSVNITADDIDGSSSAKWGIGLTTRLDGALVRLEYEQMQVEFDEIPELPLDLKFRQLTLGVVWLF